MARRNKKLKKQKNKKSTVPVVNASLAADIKQVFTHALTLHKQGNYQDAVPLYEMVLSNNKNHADSWHLLGLIAHELDQTEKAYELIKKAIAIDASIAIYYYNLGKIQQENKRVDLALKNYQKAIKLQPDYVNAFENIGVIYQDKGDFVAAKKASEHALKINPHSHIGLMNMGTLHNIEGQHEMALEFFEQLLLEQPFNYSVRLKRSHLYLICNDFKGGWDEYRWGFLADEFLEYNPVRLIPFPKWDGSSLKGKRILVNADQGVGDETMFSSCLTDVLNEAESVILECSPRLQAIFQRSFPRLEVIARAESLEFFWTKDMGNIDCRIFLSELPRFYRHKQDDFPQKGSYLSVNPSLLNAWQSQLAALPHNINIGISWRGGKEGSESNIRSIALSYWLPLFEQNDVNIINLQYGDHEREINEFQHKTAKTLHRIDGLDPMGDLDDVMAFIACLDLVITVDNSTAHFSGPIGTPVWLVLARGTNWWWQRQRSSVWYASATLYRAEKVGKTGLAQVLKNMAYDLPDFIDEQEKNKSLVSSRLINHAYSVEDELGTNATIAVSDWRKLDFSLLLNDACSWEHMGSVCASLAIHSALRQQWQAVVSVPIYALRDLQDKKYVPQTWLSFKSESIFSTFCRQYAPLIEKIRLAGKIYIHLESDSLSTKETFLPLMYLAYVCQIKFNKSVQFINAFQCVAKTRDYDELYQYIDTITAGLITLDTVVSQPLQDVFLLPNFIHQLYSHDEDANNKKQLVVSGAEYWSEPVFMALGALSEQLTERGYSIKLLIGASTKLAEKDVGFSQAMVPFFDKSMQLSIAWTEADWLSTLDRASVILTGEIPTYLACIALAKPVLFIAPETILQESLLKLLHKANQFTPDENNLQQRLSERITELENETDIEALLAAKPIQLQSLSQQP